MAKNGRPAPDPHALVNALPYARVSTPEQEADGLSLGTQRQDVLAFIAQKGWIAGTWRQDARTGRKPKREQYQELLAEARTLATQGQPCVVVMPAVDRFGRNLAESARAYQELSDLGISLWSLREGELDAMKLGIFATLAQVESDNKSARISEVRQGVEANGWAFPRHPAFGLRLRPATTTERAAGSPRSVLDVDGQAAPYMVLAFERIANGESVASISRWLGSLPADVRGSRKLGRMALTKLLRSRVYVGETTDGSAGNWPALVDRATWQRVQDRLDETPDTRNRHTPRNYVLSTFLRCPVCGAGLTGQLNNGSVRRYVCAHGADAGSHHTIIGAPAIDTTVLAEVGAVLKLATSESPTLRQAIAVAQQAEAHRAHGTPVTDERRRLAGVLDSIGKEIGALGRLLAQERMTEDAYQLSVQAAQAERKTVAEALQALDVATPVRPPVASTLELARSWRHRLATADVSTARTVLAELVTSVVPVRVGFGRYAARIHWTAAGWVLFRLTRGVVPAELEADWEQDSPPAQGTETLWSSDGRRRLAWRTDLPTSEDPYLSLYRGEPGMSLEMLSALAKSVAGLA